MKPWMWRAAAWAVFLIVAAVRPGVDRADRWLAAGSWDVPSEWNAIADVAIATGAVDGRIGGAPAPWRQASVLPLRGSRVAVVTVSDLSHSRSTFLNEHYGVLGVLARTTTDPALVTDETRGYKPLSHIWPVVEQGGRLQTLMAFAPLRSDPPMAGLFAYVALGAEENELLFVCRLGSAPGPVWGELARADTDSDRSDDLVLYLRGQRNVPPAATFKWHSATRSYTANMTEQARPLIAWWSTTAAERVTLRRDKPIDDSVRAVAARFDRDGTAAGAQ